ncbi:MAG TPA: hypothetical protein VHZ96_26355 [Frankiaceae bacterium]|jgi:hypothetical protein|nr:hypothetical protein [Frankiaceae bacterium]
MTATQAQTADLPDHNGEAVESAQIKFTGLGTGFDGLDVQPVFMDIDDVRYFVVKAKASESPSAKRTKKGELIWLNRVTVESMAPFDRATAEKALGEYADQVKRMRTEMKGQLSLDAEAEAVAAEKLDESGTVAEIADAAKKRAAGAPG